VSLEIDATTGAIASLMDRRQGTDLIDGKRCGFSAFSGRPNPGHPAAQGAPKEFDSRKSKAEISWVERGSVRAVVKAVHIWPQIRFEHWVTSRQATICRVTVRVLAEVPPPGEGKINGWQFPLEIVEATGFRSLRPSNRQRYSDFPFGIEAPPRRVLTPDVS